jgi:hypothetical protein
MKKIILFLLATSCYVLLPGCKKNDPPHHSSACKLLKIESKEMEYYFAFEYNAKNQLISRKAAYMTRMSPDYKFIYDSTGRLAQYITNADPDTIGGFFWQWHYLYYDNLGRIVKDTFYADGTIGPDGPVFPEGMPPGYTMGIENYEYDANNRMISRSGLFNDSYAYNAQGNLENDGYGNSLQYDNKVNFNRTDPVLQFINRDYSRNNPIGAKSYNQYGLPLKYQDVIHGDYSLVIDYAGLRNPVFTYKCK